MFNIVYTWVYLENFIDTISCLLKKKKVQYFLLCNELGSRFSCVLPKWLRIFHHILQWILLLEDRIIYISIEQILIKHLLCARYCSSFYLQYTGEQTKPNISTFPKGPYLLADEDVKQAINIVNDRNG